MFTHKLFFKVPLSPKFMKIHLVSGGCGYIGRNLVKRLYETTEDTILFIDNLLTGEHPFNWLDVHKVKSIKDIEVYGTNERLLFLQLDFKDWLTDMLASPRSFQNKYGYSFERFSNVFHFATSIDHISINNELNINIANYLVIDELFFKWVAEHQPQQVVYASSSDIYHLDQPAIANSSVKENRISFTNNPTTTTSFRESKIKGEHLAQMIAQNHNVSIACIRPFEVYGKDQKLGATIPLIATRIVCQEDPLEIETGHQFDLIYIDDVLDGIFVAMQNIQDGSALNLGSGKLTALLEVAHTLCELADFEPTIQQAQNTNTLPLANAYFSDITLGKSLGWQPKISLEQGLADIYVTALERERAAEVV